jgi:hypothetical protein
MSTLLNNKLKLDVKGQDSEVAKFISTTENAEIILQADYKNLPNEYAVIGSCIEDSSSNIYGISTYIGTQEKSRLAAFNVTNSDLTTTTIIRGNLLITGSALSLGTSILNDETDEAFMNAPKSIYSNLISERYTSLLVSNINNTCNIISDSISELHQTLNENVSNLYTLAKLFEGISFTTFTDADFDAALRSKTLENIPNGEINKYIQNRIYPTDLSINGNVIASNLITETVIATEVRGAKLYGDASQLLNLNKGDGTTSSITEGSNLFYKTERVVPIIEASNIHASNYISTSYAETLAYEIAIHSNMSNYVVKTSNYLHGYVYQGIQETSNTIQSRTDYLFGYLDASNLHMSNISSNFEHNFSNIVDTAIHHLTEYIQTTSNQIAGQFIYDMIGTSNFSSNTDITFHTDLMTTSNMLTEDIIAYSNALVNNINISEQDAIFYSMESSNLIRNAIITSVIDASNYVATTFEDIYQHLDSTITTLLSDASTVQTNLTAFIDNSNVIQNTLNTNASNAIVNQALFEMSNITEYTLQTDALLSNMIMTNYEMTSNNIEINSNYISTRMKNLFDSLSIISVDTSNYIFNTSNDIIASINVAFDKQMDDVSADIENVSNLVADRIDALNCDKIIQGTKQYFGSNMFFDNIRTLTLDNLRNGTQNKYITNGVYADNLTVSCNLYASNLSIIGNDTVMLTNTIATDALQILSSAYPSAFSATQMVASKNILEAYDYQSNIIFAVKPTAVNIGISNILLEPKDIVQEYVYYQFKQQSLDKDTSGNNKSLVLNGATYALNEGKNSLLIAAGNQSTMPSENWSTFNDLTISGWFKITNLAPNNILLDFAISASQHIKIFNKQSSINILSFQINNIVVYETPTALQNGWIHILWNISSISPNAFVRLSIGNKNTYTKTLPSSGTYTNKLGSTTNTGSIYVSDFRILTTPLTNSLENILYTYIDNAYQLNVFGTVKASSFIGSGLYLYDVNLTDKTTSELAEDPDPNSLRKYFTDARASAIIDASNVHMSNLVDNVSNLLAQRQYRFIASESNYWTSSSNNIIKYINTVNGFQSNLILSTSNALILKGQQHLINNNQSNYVLTTSNQFINLINTYNMHTSNYVLQSSNVLANLNRIANINNSNYILSYSNSVIQTISKDRIDTSNLISTTSNALFRTFISLETPQSNYTSNISNIFVSAMNSYRIDTSNYILSISNFNANLFRDNNTNTSNYIRYSSNMTIMTISDLINNPVLTGQSQTQTNYINRWQEPSPYVTTSLVNTTSTNYILYKDGNVGIGTNAPTATLDIFTANAARNSVKVNNSIWAQTGVVYSSDARIKKDIVDIDDGDALAKIMSIQPKIYDYIDSHRHKNKTDVYGFIAQQVGEVIPNAISLQTEAIPNIYCFGMIYNNVLMINDEIQDADNLLKEGAKVAILFGNSKYIMTIEGIYSQSVYAVDNPHDLAGNAFVYGTVVNDFYTLDKNYIYALNVCATQDLHRRQVSIQSKFAELQDRYKLNAIDNMDIDISKLSASLDDMNNNSNLIVGRYSEIQEEYARLHALNAEFAAIIGSSNADYNTVSESVNKLRQDNERLQMENEMISSNNSVLRSRVEAMSGKVVSIRDILQRNNII